MERQRRARRDRSERKKRSALRVSAPDWDCEVVKGCDDVKKLRRTGAGTKKLRETGAAARGAELLGTTPDHRRALRIAVRQGQS
jgi:hypothetical protein